MRKHLCLGALAALLQACALIPQSATAPVGDTPKAQYKFDLSGDVNGTPFQGVGVIPLNAANNYTLTINSAVSVDMITIESCHRSWSDQDMPIEVGNWFKPNHGFTFTFNLADGIENLGTCLWRIGAYNKSGQPQAWAILDFITPESTLPAINHCDGDQGPTRGVSICQSKAGLDEMLEFSVPVELATVTDPQCAPKTPKDGKHWFYVLPNKNCVVYFQEIAPPHRIHRHTFFGYSAIQLHSVNP